MPDAHASERRNLSAAIRDGGQEQVVRGSGTGPIDAFVDAMRKDAGIDIHVADYREHAIGHGEDASAIAYVEIRI